MELERRPYAVERGGLSVQHDQDPFTWLQCFEEGRVVGVLGNGISQRVLVVCTAQYKGLATAQVQAIHLLRTNPDCRLVA